MNEIEVSVVEWPMTYKAMCSRVASTCIRVDYDFIPNTIHALIEIKTKREKKNSLSTLH